MSGALILVQSFRGDPSRTVPFLWAERLGVEPANELWRRYGRSMWWQAWSQDGDAYLILPASTLPVEIQGLHRQRVGSMEVLASDELHSQQLAQRLKRNQASKISVQPESLFASCLQMLAEAPGVYWSADALATISGTIAPLLQQGRDGCVRLRLQSDRLLWNGVIGNRPLTSATLRKSIVGSSSIDSASDHISSDRTLLQIDGQRLDLILGTLLSRQIIQAPLEEHYGINTAMRKKIADLPFSLRLQSFATGAYKAGLQIQLPLSGERQQWLSILNAVSERLQSRGLLKVQKAQVPPNPQPPTLWQQEDDSESRNVGGWQIIKGEKTPVLSIGFGIEPNPQSFLEPLDKHSDSAVRITADPMRLTELGLLGGLWPKPVRQAKTLTLSINPLKGPVARNTWWRISGSLTLRPAS